MGGTFGPSLDDYTSPCTGNTGPAAYEADLANPCEEFVRPPFPLGDEPPFPNIQDDDEGGGGDGGGGGGGPTSTSVTGSESITGQRNVKISGLFDEQRNEIIRQTVRRYIDIPTPEQVLDDFETGVSAYMDALVQAGAMSRSDQALAMSTMMPVFLSDYLADLGQRAARGEDIYRVVGVEGEPEFIGTRAGEVSDTIIDEETRRRGKTTTDEAGTTTSSSTSTGTAKQGGESQQNTRSEVAQRSETTTTRKQEDTTETGRTRRRTEQTEEIFARPELARVRAISPAAFMMNKYGNVGQFTNIIRSRSGERAAARSKAERGPRVSAGRRA